MPSKSNKLVSDKIKVLRSEGKGQAQSIATAISMNKSGRLRPGGKYIGKSSRRSSRS